MSKISRRKFATYAGAGALLAPFVQTLFDRPAQAAPGKRAKRLLLFCSMGTAPHVWSPTGVSGESTFTFSESTAPLAKAKQHLVLIEGLSSGNPGNNHGAPDALTGVGHGGKPMISVEQYVAEKLKAAGVNRPIPALLLGADSTAGGGRTMFHRGQNLPTIAAPLSAYNTVFGGAAPTSVPPDKLLKRRKSVLDLVRGEIGELNKALGAEQRARMDLHLTSIRQLENRLMQSTAPTGGATPAACKKGTSPGGDTKNPITANLAHVDVAIGAFACDVTRVAAVQFGSDQTMQVDLPEIGLQGDQHGGFIHSGAPDFKNLIKLERWLCERFVEVINKLKAIPEADGSGSLFDNTLLVWARDMGDAPNHNQKDMRFVLAGGAGGYLKTHANGRYLKGAGDGAAARHERLLLNLCDAFGITDFSGFGDPRLVGADKTPIAGIFA